MQLLSKSHGEIPLTHEVPAYLKPALIHFANQNIGIGMHGDFLFQDFAFHGGLLRVSHLVARADETIFILDDHSGIFFQLVLMDTLNCHMNGLGQFVHHEWGYNSFCTSSVFKEIVLRKGHTYKVLEVKLTQAYWENLAGNYTFTSDFCDRARSKISSRLAKFCQIANCEMMLAAERILDGSAVPLNTSIHRLLAASFERQIDAPVMKPHRLSQPEVDRIYEIKRFVLDNIRQRHTLRELSRIKDIDLYQLRKGFKAVYGMTALELAHIERMRKASELLGRGDKKAWEIATLLGYHSESAFSRALRSYNKVNAYKMTS